LPRKSGISGDPCLSDGCTRKALIDRITKQGGQMLKLNKLEQIEDRLKEIERILIGKGHLRAATKQGAAIAFIVEHLETLQEMIEERKQACSPA
jgi:hypothetical protein